MSFGTKEKCTKCEKTVYLDERVVVDKKVMHESCFRCTKCKTKLKLGTYAEFNGQEYCKPHFQEAFRLAGNYKFMDKEKEKDFHSQEESGQNTSSGLSWREIEQQKEEERKQRQPETVTGTFSKSEVRSGQHEDTIWNKGKSAIAQSMISTEDMMPVEEQLARLKRQLEKRIITREQYEMKIAEIERKKSGVPSPTVVTTASPRTVITSKPTTVASVPLKRSSSRIEAHLQSPSMRKLIQLTKSEDIIEQTLNETTELTEDQQQALSKLKALLDRGIINQSEYDRLLREKRVELGIASEEPKVSPATPDVHQKIENEKQKLQGLVSRGLITRQEYDTLVIEKNLLERGVITREEYESLINTSHLVQNEHVKQPEELAPQEPVVQQEAVKQPETVEYNPEQQPVEQEQVQNDEVHQEQLVQHDAFDGAVEYNPEQQPVEQEQVQSDEVHQEQLVQHDAFDGAVENHDQQVQQFEEESDDPKTRLEAVIHQRKSLLDQINLEMEEKRLQLDKLVQEFNQVADELQHLENELEQYH